MARRSTACLVLGGWLAALAGCGGGSGDQPNPNLEIPKTSVPADVKPSGRGGMPGVGGKAAGPTAPKA